MRLFILLNTIVSVFAFMPNAKVHHRGVGSFARSSRTTTTTIRAVTTSDVPAEGGRSLVEGPNGTIIVTKSGGSFYAVDAICPHLNLPMKKGKIEAGADGVPIITCNFHNSCFRMDSGKW
jgi:nitrite reductase/ring-hydroxylating ferredoxin subunit